MSLVKKTISIKSIAGFFSVTPTTDASLIFQRKSGSATFQRALDSENQ